MLSGKEETSDTEVLVSIVIPCRSVNDYLRETIRRVLEQDYQDFEILVLPDSVGDENFPKTRIIPTKTGPAEKRDLALGYAAGKILAFLDDDAYPRRDWLRNALPSFNNPEVAAVCGPGLTPPTDSPAQKASGWVSASRLGGGLVSFRFTPRQKREVDDFPAMNFLVRRRDFEVVHGFDSRFWPGEDSKLCLELVRKLGKKIIYDPGVVVYHHRRPLFRAHLKQNGQFGRHRGYFARVFPATSRKWSYFAPSLFVLGLVSGPFLALVLPRPLGGLIFFVYGLTLLVYAGWLILTSVWVYTKEKNLRISFLVVPGIFLTHVWYGLKFLQGFFTPRLET